MAGKPISPRKLNRDNSSLKESGYWATFPQKKEARHINVAQMAEQSVFFK